jgi:hypothetical protein
MTDGTDDLKEKFQHLQSEIIDFKT